MKEQEEKKILQIKYFYSVIDGELFIEERTRFKDEEDEVKHFHFPLTKADKDEIFQLRLKRQKEKILFILKQEDKYWYAEIPKEMNGRLEEATHLCGKPCKYLSALSDAKGGCAIARDRDRSYYRRKGMNKELSIKKSDRIEKYDFVHNGYEVFGTAQDTLVVTECSRYARCY